MKLKLKLTTKKQRRKVLILSALALVLSCYLLAFSLTGNLYFANSSSIPMTGEHEFDIMYQKYMEKDMPMIDDIMEPANYAGFFVIRTVTGIVGILLLVVSVVTFSAAIAYGLRPDIADEVHDIKMEVANGGQIPFDDPIRFILQFMPDVKAASGIADDYEFERPTIGLVFRDNIFKFLILFSLALALKNDVITTFLVKGGGAIAYGARHYVDNTDMRGIINTWTTAGKDFNPQYNTLLPEERNKKKTFNAIYNAIKTVYPRERSQEFLNQIGAEVVNFVQNDISNDLYLKENFSASADIYSYGTEKLPSGITDTEIRKVFTLPMATVLGANFNLEKSDYTIYVTILAYDEKQTASEKTQSGEPYGNNTEILGDENSLTSIDLTLSTSDSNNGFAFRHKNTASPIVVHAVGQYQIGDEWKRTQSIKVSIPASKVSVTGEKISISLDDIDEGISDWIKKIESTAKVSKQVWYSVQVDRTSLINSFDLNKANTPSKSVEMVNGYSRVNRDLSKVKSE